jgi:hypothetical protein
MVPEAKDRGNKPKRKTGGRSSGEPRRTRGPRGPRSRRRSSRGGKDDGDGPAVCDVKGCDKDSERSISFRKAREAMEDWGLAKDGPRRLKVCKDHYREFKKATKADRDIDRAGWSDMASRKDGR